MPNITIDGTRLYYCEMRSGSKNTKKAFLDLQPTILSLWNIYNDSTKSETKREEAKQALLYYEEFLKLSISGTPEDNLIKSTPELMNKIYSERNACQRDILNFYDKKRVNLDDATHQYLSSMGNSESMLDAQTTIQGIKDLKPKK